MRCSLLVAKLDMIMVHLSQKASKSNKGSFQMNVSYQVEEIELDRRELCWGKLLPRSCVQKYSSNFVRPEIILKWLRLLNIAEDD